jgi:hypothetical protein
MVAVVVAVTLGASMPVRGVTGFSLTSSAFADGAAIPVQFTCHGAGDSPPLAWANVPKRTRRLALIVRDPDAPSGTFVHWVTANFPALPASIAPGHAPAGAYEGTNGAGRPGWTPPCPPAGPPHHYVFTLYALKQKVKLPLGATATTVRRAMQGKILGRATLTGTYGT